MSRCLFKPVGGGAGGPGSEIGGGNQTIGAILQIPPGAAWIRFRFACWSAADVPVANAAYAASAQAGDGYNAYDGTGAPSRALWRPITFGHPGATCIEQILNPAAAPSHAFTLPGIRGAAPAEYQPQAVLSDWMRFSPLPRADGAEALLAIRLYVPPDVPAFRLGHAAAPALDVTIAGSYSFGNNAVPPYGGYGTAFPVSPVHGLDLILAHPARTLIVTGDSIASGDYTTGGATCYGLAAARALCLAGHPTTAAILANPLQTTLAYLGNAYNYLAADPAGLAGAVIVIPCWSGNDPAGIAAAEAGFAAALAFASFCRSHGLTPILATAAPVCAAAPEHEAGRAAANALVRAAGLPCLDIDAITGAGTTPNSYKPGFAAWDNVHLGDAGQRIVARALGQMIPKLFAPQTDARD